MTRPFAAKAWLGGAGMVVGLAGAVWERPVLVWAAIALLAGAVILRLWERRGGPEEPPP